MRSTALEPIVCLLHLLDFDSYNNTTQGMGLAAHLQVPLPYLLYRVNARFQEEIRGLKDVQGALRPATPQHQFPIIGDSKPPSSTTKAISNENRVPISRHGTPLGIRSRLNSLSNNFAHRHKKVSTSSSTMTLQETKRPLVSTLRPTSPSSSSDDTDSSDEEALKDEEAERIAEEEEILSRKLAELQKMMTSESIGLVSGTTRQKGVRTMKDRGRTAPISPLAKVNFRQDSLSHYSASASRSASQSVSSASSPQGSIPDIRNVTAAGPRLSMPRNPSSSPAFAGRNAQSHQMQRRYGPLVERTGDLSSHGSEASSFSDLSGKMI